MSAKQPALVRTESELAHAVSVISSFPEYVIDIETDGINPRTNALSWVGLGTYGEVFLIPIQHRRGRLVREERLTKHGRPSKAQNPPVHKRYYADPGEQLMPDVVTAAIEELLFGEQLKIGHNVKFDMLSLAKYYRGRLPEGPFNDTLVMQHVVDENRRSYSLKDIVPDFLRIPKEDRKTFYPKLGKDIAAHPIDAVARYLAQDVRYCWLLWQALCGWVAEEGMWDILQLEMDLYPVIMRMEAAGAFVDPQHLDEMEQALEEEIQDIERDAWTTAKVRVPFALTNTNMKRDLLFNPRDQGGQGLRPLSFTPKQHIPQLTQATLEHYAGTNKLALLFLEYSEKQKLLGTYIHGLRARLNDGKIHTSFTQHATVTGRLSSRNPNLQNIPRDSNVRALFIAPPGYSLVVADYDQIELRVTAHFSRDDKMREIFLAGEDIHAGTFAAITGKKIADVTKDERQVGKGLNFAVVYGAGPDKVAAMSGVTVTQARFFMHKYYERFGNIEPWKQHVLNEARRRGDRHHPYLQQPYVTTMLGRKRRLPDLFSYDRAALGRAERQAINHRVQGTAAEIMKIAMIRVDRAFADTPFTLILTVHDEIVSLCPEGTEAEAQEVVVAALSGITLSERPIIDVPLVVSCGTAKRWSEAK
jgi:DNA polymerase I-like protein with 3'-5' exonuclease and polymerase domains